MLPESWRRALVIVPLLALASAACRAPDDQGTPPVIRARGSGEAIRPSLPAPWGATWVYVVGSDAESDLLHDAIASVPGAPSVVMVASTASEAAAIREVELGLNPARQFAGEPEVRVLVLGPLAGE